MLSSLIVTQPLCAKSAPAQWQIQAIKAFKLYEASGTDAFVAAIEKDTQRKLSANDLSYLRKNLGAIYKLPKIRQPQLKQDSSNLVISWNKDSQSILSFQSGKEPVIKLDGKVLTITQSDGIEEISQKVWALLAPKHGWGPYPSSKKTSASFWINLILPQAHAETGTWVAIAIAVAVIAAIAYLAHKSGESMDKAGDAAAKSITKVGNSAAKGIDKVSTSASGTLDAATQTLETANDTMEQAQDNLQSVTDNLNDKVNEVDVNTHINQIPTDL